MVRAGDPGWDGRAHFIGTAARAMRQIIIDYARKKSAKRRGGNSSVLSLDLDGETDIPISENGEQLLSLSDIDEAMLIFDSNLKGVRELRI